MSKIKNDLMLVYLKPLSSFPLLHSDTIFGALCSTISEIFSEKTDEIISDFENNPPFIVSSAFPYLKNDDEIIRFYPKPIDNMKIDGNANVDNLKRYKGIEYIEEEIFFKLIDNSIKESDIINNMDNDEYYVNKTLLLNKNSVNNNLEYSYSKNVIPKNKINRMNNTSDDIFYTTGYRFRNMGLYFMVKFYDNKYIDMIKSAIKFLKDRGFGKNISTGEGQFDYKIVEESKLNQRFENINGGYFITLSRYIPTQNEVNYILKQISDDDDDKKNNYSYEISSKRGRSSDGQIRKQVRFFIEGSIFPHYQRHYGQIIQSGTLKNPSVEYGYAFPINYNK